MKELFQEINSYFVSKKKKATKKKEVTNIAEKLEQATIRIKLRNLNWANSLREEKQKERRRLLKILANTNKIENPLSQIQGVKYKSYVIDIYEISMKLLKDLEKITNAKILVNRVKAMVLLEMELIDEKLVNYDIEHVGLVIFENLYNELVEEGYEIENLSTFIAILKLLYALKTEMNTK